MASGESKKCIYDPTHDVPPKETLAQHYAKCSNRKPNPDIIQCRNDATHRLYKWDMEEHLKECDQNPEVLRASRVAKSDPGDFSMLLAMAKAEDAAKAAGVNEPRQNVQIDGQENWDYDYASSNVLEDTQCAAYFKGFPRRLEATSPYSNPERKKFDAAEKKRVARLENGESFEDILDIKYPNPNLNGEDCTIKELLMKILGDEDTVIDYARREENRNILKAGNLQQGHAASALTGPTPYASAVTGPTPYASAVTGPTPYASAVTGPTPYASAVTGPTPYASAVTGPTPYASELTGPTPCASAVTGPTPYTSSVNNERRDSFMPASIKPTGTKKLPRVATAQTSYVKREEASFMPPCQTSRTKKKLYEVANFQRTSCVNEGTSLMASSNEPSTRKGMLRRVETSQTLVYSSNSLSQAMNTRSTVDDSELPNLDEPARNSIEDPKNKWIKVQKKRRNKKNKKRCD